MSVATVLGNLGSRFCRNAVMPTIVTGLANACAISFESSRKAASGVPSPCSSSDDFVHYARHLGQSALKVLRERFKRCSPPEWILQLSADKQESENRSRTYSMIDDTSRSCAGAPAPVSGSPV